MLSRHLSRYNRYMENGRETGNLRLCRLLLFDLTSFTSPEPSARHLFFSDRSLEGQRLGTKAANA